MSLMVLSTFGMKYSHSNDFSTVIYVIQQIQHHILVVIF